MAIFEKGNRVEIIPVSKNGTGTIVSEASSPSSYSQQAGRINWWRVKMDETGEEKDFSEDSLVLLA